MLRRCGGSCSDRSNRRIPTSSLGTSVAPRTGHGPGGSSVASTARSPPTSESSQNRARSSSIWMPPSSHPAGSDGDARHRRRPTAPTAPSGSSGCRCRTSGCRRRRGRGPGVNRPAVACTPNSDHDDDQRPRARSAAGSIAGARSRRCGGASARKRASRSRPSCFMTVRSCVGLATPRAAANASAISSGVKYRSARSYTRSASVRTASTSIMLARSTAWRHGDGRTCTNATSMSSRCPSRTSRFAGLMSRCASPASQSLRTSARPSSMISSSTSASPISVRTVEELGDEQVLARGRELDDAVRLRGRDAGRRA